MADQHSDWLPAGWTVNVKVRSYGRKDKYYIHPTNGRKFNSKAEVLRYLKSSKEAKKPKKRNKVDIERTAAENLPPGWIKELRIKKKGHSIRKDPFYIDPVSGRYFNSLQGVYRYLQSADSGQTESNEQNHISVKLENHPQSSSAEPKEQRSIAKKPDKTISRRKEIRSEVKLSGGSVGSAMEMVIVGNNSQVAQKEECDSLTLEFSDKLQPVSRADRYAYRMRRLKEVNETTMREIVGADHRSKSGSTGVTKDIDVAEPHGLAQRREHNDLCEGEQQQDVAPQNKRKNRNCKFVSELPRRSSKRLAHVEVDASIEVTRCMKPRVTAKSSGKVEICTAESKSDIRPSGDANIIITGQNGYFEEPNEQPTKYKYPTCSKEQELLVRSLFEDLSCIEDLDSVCVDNEEDGKAAGKLVDNDPTLENLFMDPCYEFAIKTLTGDIPINDLNKDPVCPVASLDQAPACSSAMPPDNLWTDPTFEFAVKMLTSDLPAKEPVSSSGASGCNNALPLANPRLSNSNNLNGFQRETKTCVRQAVGDPSPSHAVNGQGRKFGGL